jgi:hypothetical protein
MLIQDIYHFRVLHEKHRLFSMIVSDYGNLEDGSGVLKTTKDIEQGGSVSKFKNWLECSDHILKKQQKDR